MTTLGYHCSHEQLPPSTLLRHVQLAADAGFTAAMCSDHFNPWTPRQGQSGFAWSWLGAALQSTPLSLGTVCAPGQRYHPAVIAQAAGTLAEMYPDRFWVAVGSGEALNEAITGAAWPPKTDRNARLRECVDVMRALWAGEEVTRQGHVRVTNARLYTRPARPPMVVGAALTVDTVRWMAGWVDAMVTAAGPRDTLRPLVEAFREHGGAGKPMFLQVAVSVAPTDDEARATAYEQWPQCALEATLLADVATPQEFEAHAAQVKAEDVLARVRASSDIERQLAWLYEDVELGFDRIYLHNVAYRHQERFIDACGTRLIPALAEPVRS